MSAERPNDASDETADGGRLCGRCRARFPRDPTLHEPGGPSWWLCDACRDVLITPPRFTRLEDATAQDVGR